METLFRKQVNGYKAIITDLDTNMDECLDSENYEMAQALLESANILDLKTRGTMSLCAYAQVCIGHNDLSMVRIINKEIRSRR